MKLGTIRGWISRHRDLVILELVALFFAVLAIILYLATDMSPLPLGPMRW